VNKGGDNEEFKIQMNEQGVDDEEKEERKPEAV
jgi:hypothetical protein